MVTTLSSKGQVVLPQAARKRLGLKPGMKFSCRVEGNRIVLTPEDLVTARPRFRREKSTGMVVTEAPAGSPAVTSEMVRSLLNDFP